jgi:hypothetical protein
LPVQSAKKVRQSLPFFGKKATQHQGRANLSLFFSWREGEATGLQTQTYLPKSSGCFLTLTKEPVCDVGTSGYWSKSLFAGRRFAPSP